VVATASLIVFTHDDMRRVLRSASCAARAMPTSNAQQSGSAAPLFDVLWEMP
jgi:hypothetical protein